MMKPVVPVAGNRRCSRRMCLHLGPSLFRISEEIMRIRRSLLSSWTAGLAVILLLCFGSARAAEVEKFLPNDTVFVCSFNVQQVLDAPLVKKHALPDLKGMLTGNEEIQKILEALGFDPLRDVSRVIFASPGLGVQDKWSTIIHGRCDVDKFHAKAQEVAKQQGGFLTVHEHGNSKFYEVTAPGQAQSIFVALVSKDRLVSASGKDYVLEALDKAAGKKKPAVRKELREVLEKADLKQSLSLAMLGDAIRNGALAGNNEAKEIGEKIKNVTGGLTVGDDVQASFVLVSKDPDGAREVADKINNHVKEAKGIVSLQAQSLKALEPLVEFLGSLKVATQGSSVTLKGQVSKELIEKSLKKE